MTDFDDIRDRLADVEQRVESGAPGIVAVGDSGSDQYPTPEEFEQRYGHPPEESDGLVIRVPEEAAEY